VQKICTIGESAYGAIYKGMYTSTKEVIALKKIKLEPGSEGVSENTFREISALREIEHRNVV
jgi:serine/threonine protein kinase